MSVYFCKLDGDSIICVPRKEKKPHFFISDIKIWFNVTKSVYFIYSWFKFCLNWFTDLFFIYFSSKSGGNKKHEQILKISRWYLSHSLQSWKCFGFVMEKKINAIKKMLKITVDQMVKA